MNIRGSKKDIENIRLGHESESYATGWLIEHKTDTSYDHADAFTAYTDGFYAGITFLANYLKEYGLTIEIYDNPVITKNKEDWYSGEVIEKE